MVDGVGPHPADGGRWTARGSARLTDTLTDVAGFLVRTAPAPALNACWPRPGRGRGQPWLALVDPRLIKCRSGSSWVIDSG